MVRLLVLLSATLLLTPPARATSDETRPAPDEVGAEVAEAALYYLDKGSGLERADCSGLIEAVLRRAGHPAEGRVKTFWADAQREGRAHFRRHPEIGELAFFDRTYDANRNGVVDDVLTHIAVVVDIEEDGTVVLVHHGSTSGISELRMNLDHPDERSNEDRELNSPVRKKGYGAPDAPRLTGQLWHGFASIAPAPARPALAGLERPALAHAETTREPPRRAPGTAASPAESRSPPPASPPGSLFGTAGGSRAGTFASAAGTRRARPSRRQRSAIRRVRGDPRFGWVLHGVLTGRPVDSAHVRGATCDELWFMRNSVFARHGYAFTTLRAQEVFGHRDWYVRDEAVTRTTAMRYLTEPDMQNLRGLLAAERSRGCRR